MEIPNNPEHSPRPNPFSLRNFVERFQASVFENYADSEVVSAYMEHGGNDAAAAYEYAVDRLKVETEKYAAELKVCLARPLDNEVVFGFDFMDWQRVLQSVEPQMTAGAAQHILASLTEAVAASPLEAALLQQDAQDEAAKARYVYEKTLELVLRIVVEFADRQLLDEIQRSPLLNNPAFRDSIETSIAYRCAEIDGPQSPLFQRLVTKAPGLITRDEGFIDDERWVELLAHYQPEAITTIAQRLSVSTLPLFASAHSTVAALPEIDRTPAHEELLAAIETAAQSDFLLLLAMIGTLQEAEQPVPAEYVDKLWQLLQQVEIDREAARQKYHLFLREDHFDTAINDAYAIVYRYAPAEIVRLIPLQSQSLVIVDLAVRRLARIGEVDAALAATEMAAQHHNKAGFGDRRGVFQALAIYAESGDERALALAHSRMEAYFRGDTGTPHWHSKQVFAIHAYDAALAQGNDTLRENALEQLVEAMKSADWYTHQMAFQNFMQLLLDRQQHQVARLAEVFFEAVPSKVYRESRTDQRGNTVVYQERSACGDGVRLALQALAIQGELDALLDPAQVSLLKRTKGLNFSAFVEKVNQLDKPKKGEAIEYILGH